MAQVGVSIINYEGFYVKKKKIEKLLSHIGKLQTRRCSWLFKNKGHQGIYQDVEYKRTQGYQKYSTTWR